MMNPSILVYRTVQCQSVDLELLSRVDTHACPMSARRHATPARPPHARPPPATCVPGTRPAPRFKPGGVASNGRLPTRPVPIARVARAKPTHAAPAHDAPAHAAPAHAAPHTPPCHPPDRPTHAPGPFAVVLLPRPRLPRAPALARRYRRREGGYAPERTPPRTAGAPVHHPPPSPPTYLPCVVHVRAAAASCVCACAWAWSGCAACTVLCSLSVPAVFLARLPRRAGARPARCAAQRATGRVSRRPFDATPPDLNRGAGLVLGMQVAGGGGSGGQATGHQVRVQVEEANGVNRGRGEADDDCTCAKAVLT